MIGDAEVLFGVENMSVSGNLTLDLVFHFPESKKASAFAWNA